jgi:hypothetical protein
MAESIWPPSEVMQEHLQNLMSQGYMTVAELATYRVPEDPSSPAPAEDMLWRAWHSTSEDLVFLRIDFSACCCSSMTWTCIT